MKTFFASAAVATAIVLVALLVPAAAITSHQETDCSGGSGPCFAAVNSPGGVGLYGGSQGGSSGAGVAGVRSGAGGYAVQANNTTGVALFAQGNPSIEARDGAVTGNPILYEGISPKGTVFTIDSKGDAKFAGKVTASQIAGATTAEQATITGQRVTTYNSASTTPTLEDVGEMGLVGGRGAVRFDARFASTMQSARYLVFVTPQGPIAGSLYVTQKTPFGFAVRETLPDRSNVAVDYRVVVQPFGAARERLPIAPAPSP
jgi:hypothetical protein